MTEKTNKERYAELATRVEAAKAALKAAEDFASENGLTFRFSPAYGMGGTFYPNTPEIRSEYDESTEENWTLNRDDQDGGWRSSSNNC